eukprot:SAG31_NODE_18314_length_640_cov_1.813309_1_plen_57_part_10
MQPIGAADDGSDSDDSDHETRNPAGRSEGATYTPAADAAAGEDEPAQSAGGGTTITV